MFYKALQDQCRLISTKFYQQATAQRSPSSSCIFSGNVQRLQLCAERLHQEFKMFLLPCILISTILTASSLAQDAKPLHNRRSSTVINNFSSRNDTTGVNSFNIDNSTNISTTGSTRSTFLILALASSSQADLDSATSGLNDHGIPFELLLVPDGDVVLPALNSSEISGNYGGIVILSELSYSYRDDEGDKAWTSALSSHQWKILYTYQVDFGVRMVRLASFPDDESGEQDSGTTSLGGCCDTDVENFLTINDTSQFPTAGLIQ